MNDEFLMSFNASGWLCVFQLGVVLFFQDNVNLDNVEVYGTSAGAVAATTIIVNLPSELAGEEMCSKELQARKDFKLMVPLMKEAINRLTPSNSYKVVNKRLNIYCTEIISFFPFKIKNVNFCNFNNNRDLIDLLCATSHIPVIGGYFPYIFKGRRLYDGLFTETHPLKENKKCFKITSSSECYCGCTNNIDSSRVIAPKNKMPLWWSFIPPDNTTLRLIYWYGYCRARNKICNTNFQKNVIINTNVIIDNSVISTTPINLISNNIKNSIYLYETIIENELKKRIEIAELKWSGISGILRWASIIFCLLIPYSPLVWLQSYIISGRYNPD